MTAVLVSLDARAGGPLVDVQSVDPTIMVELRYAGRNNRIGHPLIHLEHVRALGRKSPPLWPWLRLFCAATMSPQNLGRVSTGDGASEL